MRDNITPYLDERIIAEKACGLGLQVQMLCEKYAEQGCAEEVRQLRMLHDRLWAIVQEVKAGFDPNQPRVPPGNRDGGQWTEIGAIPGNDEVTFVKTIPHPTRGLLNRANIFVGGFDDDAKKIVRNSFSLLRYTYGDNYYAEQDANDNNKIVELIMSMPKGRTINLIGHSWGGDTAAKVAVQVPGRVSILITIDPVSIFRPDLAGVRKQVRRWINVNALGNPNSSILEGLRQGGLAAGVGSSWDKEPTEHAHIHSDTPFNHSNFDHMMFYAAGDDFSPLDILNVLEE